MALLDVGVIEASSALNDLLTRMPCAKNTKIRNQNPYKHAEGFCLVRISCLNYILLANHARNEVIAMRIERACVCVCVYVCSSGLSMVCVFLVFRMWMEVWLRNVDFSIRRHTCLVPWLSELYRTMYANISDSTTVSGACVEV